MARVGASGRQFRLTLAAVLLLICVFAPAVSASHHGSHLHARHSYSKHTSSPAARSVGDLNRRDAYSCDAANPCSNGACCGVGGYCGYSDTYYGARCMSNCDATAQCGKDAAHVNATCPLNVCCRTRNKIACCTVRSAPSKPAVCGSDMYTLFLGYCPTDNDDESANDRTKRDMVDVTPTQWPATLAIEKRGAAARYVAIAGKVTVEILAAAYPSIGDLFGVKNFNQILRVGFTLAERYCTVPGLSKFTIPSGKTPSGLSGMHSEHVIDRQVIVSFIKAAVSDVLASGKLSKLTPIPISFWQAVWLAGNAALGARPAVGSSNGISPNTPNARVMEAFGSRYYPSPILATDTNINGPKGRLMGLKAAASINRIRTLAEMAVKNDDTKSAANLLTAIRDGFSVFEYLNDPHVTRKWNTVLQQVALQWSYAEKDAGQAGLQEWWWEWAQDYLQLVEDNGQGWAAEAIQAAAGIYTNARVVGKTLATHEEVISALSSFQSKISNLHMPAIPVTKTPSS